MASKLLSRVRHAIRVRGYSIRTEQAYISWIVRYVRFHNLEHPAQLGDDGIKQFLTYLAVTRNVAPNTQNQALSALLFLYRNVLNQPVGDISGATRAKKPQKLPVVLSRDEVTDVLSCLPGQNRLIGSLLYGSGLRLMEALQLRVKDLDFGYQGIHVHNAKGAKDRVVTFPKILHPAVHLHLGSVRRLHALDLKDGYGSVYLPYALARKYRSAAAEWKWHHLFPAARLSVDPRSGATRRHHMLPSTFQKAIRTAVLKAGVSKPASSHTLRHSFATLLLKTASTFAPCKNSWATHRLKPPRFTPMSWNVGRTRSGARLRTYSPQSNSTRCRKMTRPYRSSAHIYSNHLRPGTIPVIPETDNS